jgi:putative PIN family toxin of toxin-antitoxin system
LRLVLDTNVLVSGLLNPLGAPARVLDLTLAGTAILLYDDRIRAEYAEVLRRPRFGFAAADIAMLLRTLESWVEPVVAPPLPVMLPDADDLPFLEVAVAGRADALVTGNVRHFTGAHGVRVATPAELVATL